MVALVVAPPSPEFPADLQGDPHVDWARSVRQDSLPASLGAAYVNQLDADEGEDRVRAAYGPATYARLVDVKTAWDKDNVFRLNPEHSAAEVTRRDGTLATLRRGE